MLINNLNTLQVTNDVIIKLTKIYQYIGKQDIFDKEIKDDEKLLVSLTAESDSYYLAKLLNLKLTDARLEYITKNHKFTPKNNREKIVKKTYILMLNLITNYKHYDIYNTVIQDIVKEVFSPLYKHKLNEVKTVNIINNKKIDTDNIKQAEEVLAFIRENNTATTNEKAYEPLLLAIITFIDYYNTDVFYDNHEIYSLILLYIELLKINVNIFKYTSLFKYIYTNYSEFKSALTSVSLYSEEGIAKPLNMERFMLNMLEKCYEEYEDTVIKHKESKNQTKSAMVVSIVFSFKDPIFQKSDIQRQLPLVSEVTINKTLAILKHQKAISSLSKGRNAKWIRNANINDFDSSILNMKISDFE